MNRKELIETNKEKLFSAWLVALRSGEYLQTRYGRHVNGRHCAMGVLEVVREELLGIPLDDHNYFEELFSIYSDVKTITGLPFMTIAQWNDSERLSFSEIADRLEERRKP